MLFTPHMLPAQTLVFLLDSLHLITHESRAFALYCLLAQAIRSLMACEKQMSAAQPLVFPCAHYIIKGMSSTPPLFLYVLLLYILYFYYTPISVQIHLEAIS